MKLSYKYRTFNVPLWVLRCLKRRMRWVRAAGCIVEDDSTGNLLLIRRNNRWDLPKGKVEDGETLLQAALRETLEETGISSCTPFTSLIAGDGTGERLPLKTYHIYNLYGGWHLKQTSWFKAHCVSPAEGMPQQEEGITDVVWVKPGEWRKRLSHSYGTMKTIAKKWPISTT